MGHAYEYVDFCEKLPKWLYNFVFPAAMNKSYHCSLQHQCVVLSALWILTILTGIVMIIHCCLNLKFPDDI